MAANECPMKKFPRASVILVVIIAAVFTARLDRVVGEYGGAFGRFSVEMGAVK